MDVDIFDIFALIVWGFIAIRIFNIRLNKKAEEYENNKNTRMNKSDDSLEENTNTPETELDTIEEAEEDSYDFAALRKKIQQSWQSEKNDQLSSSDMTQVIYKEKEISPQNETVNPYQAYLKKTNQKKRKKTLLEESGAAVSDTTFSKEKEWSENDVRIWIKYNAIFGEPRSKKKWVPFGT